MCPSIDSRAEEGVDLLRREVGSGIWTWCLLSSSSDGQTVYENSKGHDTLIGTFAPDGKSEQSYRALQKLSECECDCLCVPHPIVYDHSLQLIVTEKVMGEACQDMPLAPAAERLRRIGRALKELHACDVELGERKSIEDHLQELVCPAPNTLATSLPQHADVIRATLDYFQTKSLEWTQLGTTPLHRDFHLRQLFDTGTRIAVVDWDLSAQGDPAFDVTYFTTYLKTHYREDEAATGIAAFLDGYGPDSDILSRTTSYEMFNFLRRACRRFRLKDDGWQKALETMLNRLRELTSQSKWNGSKW